MNFAIIWSGINVTRLGRGGAVLELGSVPLPVVAVRVGTVNTA
jgi:hypothetical protein